MNIINKLLFFVIFFVALPLCVSAQNTYEGTITAEESIALEVPENGFFTITIKTEENLSTPEYNLYDKTTGELIDRLSFNQNNKEFKFALKKGTYELKMKLTSGKESAGYYFTTSFEKGDSYDFNGHHTFETAVPIPMNTDIKGNYAVYDRSDLYVLTVKEAAQLHVKTDQGILQIFDENHKRISLDYSKEIRLNVKPGKYYIAIKGSFYTFSYTIDKLLENVEIEPNYQIQSANQLLLGTLIAGKGNTSEDEDAYSFSMKEDGFATFEFLIDDWGSPKFSIYNSSGNLMYKFHENGEFTLGLKKGNYTFVLAETGSRNYKIHYKKSDPYPYPNLENNDSEEKAQPLLINKKLRAIAPGGLNYSNNYKIELDEANFVKVHIDTDQPLTINLMIDGYGVDTKDIVSENQKKGYDFYFGLNKGQHILSVHISEDLPYTISYEKFQKNGEIEPNETMSTANPLKLSTLTYGNLSLRHDIDFYKFTLDKEEVVTLNINCLNDHDKCLKTTLSGQMGWIWEANVNTAVSQTLKLSKGKYSLQINGNGIKAANLYTVKVETEQNGFSDVPFEYKFYNEITKIRKLGIITGYPDGTFKPTAKMQRQHVAAMIVRSNAPAISDSIHYFNFPDVPPTHANYENINKLVSGGIIDANPNGFKPNDSITRAQMAKILVLAYQLEPKGNEKMTFKDVPEKAWFAPYVEILAQNGYAKGDNGYFNPNEPLTREQFCIFLFRVLQ